MALDIQKKDYINDSIKIINNDCFDEIDNFKDDSIDCVITDPPYFIDKLDNTWSETFLKNIPIELIGTLFREILQMRLGQENGII